MEDPKLDLLLDFEADLSDAERAELDVLDQLADEPLTDTEQRHMLLLDIQARHAARLASNDILWRASIEATEPGPDTPERPVLNEEAMYRACIFRKRARQGGVNLEQAGVRFITSQYVEAGINNHPVVTIEHTAFDVPVYTNVGSERRLHTSFGDEHADVIASMIPELEAARESLLLSVDLTAVLTSRAS